MDEQAAKLVIAAGASIGALFWLMALGLYRKLASAQQVQKIEARIPGKYPAETIKDLLAASKDVLADARVFSAQPRLTRPAENRLLIEQGGLEVRMEATRVGGGTLLVAEVDDSKYTRRFLLGLGAYVLILMPVVIGGAAVAMWHFVAPSERPAIRWQSLQILQISHVLWPPFLIYALWNRPRSQVASAVSNLLVFAQAGVGAEDSAE